MNINFNPSFAGAFILHTKPAAQEYDDTHIFKYIIDTEGKLPDGIQIINYSDFEPGSKKLVLWDKEARDLMEILKGIVKKVSSEVPAQFKALGEMVNSIKPGIKPEIISPDENNFISISAAITRYVYNLSQEKGQIPIVEILDLKG